MKYKLNLPSYSGEVVEERLKVLETNKVYEGYTLNEKLEIVKVVGCSIENNGNYNYHNNYDNSENVLKVNGLTKWWTVKESEIKTIQKKHIDEALDKINEELLRLESLL